MGRPRADSNARASQKSVSGDSVMHTLPSRLPRIASLPAIDPFDPRYVLVRALLRVAEVRPAKPLAGAHHC
jgi:hypothetical protein